MSSWARYDKEFTDEKIFTAGIVEEGVVLTAEESLERILWGREKGGVAHCPVDVGPQHISGYESSEDPTHLTSRLGGAP